MGSVDITLIPIFEELGCGFRLVGWHHIAAADLPHRQDEIEGDLGIRSELELLAVHS